MKTTKPIGPRYARSEPMRRTLVEARSEPMRRTLVEIGARLLDETEDRRNILWQRWVLPNGNIAVLWATPEGWDVFLAACASNSVEDTIRAVREAAASAR